MITAQKILDEVALGERQIPHTVAECLAFVARGERDLRVGLGRTARMDGDLLAAAQPHVIRVYYPDSDVVHSYYVADDAGWYGGPVTHSADGNSWVPAEYVDGVHRLNAVSGELVDPEVLL